jgi:thiol-disulfide isomerase/thioredoxin
MGMSATPSPTPSSKPAPASRGSFLLGLLRDWGIAIIVVVLVMVGFNAFFAPKQPTNGPAPDFALLDLDGKLWTLSELDERVVVLNFWFTDCPPCRKEIPDLIRWQAANPDVPLLGIHTDPRKPPGVIKRVSDQLGINYTVLDDRKAEAARAYGISNFPTTIVLVDGAVVGAKVGLIDEAKLDRMVSDARK